MNFERPTIMWLLGTRIKTTYDKNKETRSGMKARRNPDHNLDLFLAVVFEFLLHLEWTLSLTTETTQDQSWASDLNWGTGT